MAAATKAQRQRTSRVRQQAQALLRDPLFLHRAMNKIGELGIIGEERNRTILFLAGLTKDQGQPVSVLVKGQSSSGKSNLVRTVVQMFPPECVLSRASLSSKAPLFGEQSFEGKLLYMFEYRGLKDAQFLIRLQQSEGIISHEFTTVAGHHRGTQVATRRGVPVVFTTTTTGRVFEDDETRYLSISIDESPDQTLEIAEAAISKPGRPSEPPLAVWHEAVRLLGAQKVQVSFPDWFRFIVSKLPISQVRVRRDWGRFLAFCKIIASCRRWTPSRKPAREIAIEFPDYCVAYRIFAAPFAATVYQVHERELSIVAAVRKLYARCKRAVTHREIAAHLRWRESLVYKYIPKAVKHGLVKYEAGTSQTNLKRLLPVPGPPKIFLPSPEWVFEENPHIGKTASYIDPITGQKKTFTRANSPQTNRYSQRVP